MKISAYRPKRPFSRDEKLALVGLFTVGSCLFFAGMFYLWNLCSGRPSSGPDSCYHHAYTLTSPIGIGVDMVVAGGVALIVDVALLMVLFFRLLQPAYEESPAR